MLDKMESQSNICFLTIFDIIMLLTLILILYSSFVALKVMTQTGTEGHTVAAAWWWLGPLLMCKGKREVSLISGRLAPQYSSRLPLVNQKLDFLKRRNCYSKILSNAWSGGEYHDLTLGKLCQENYSEFEHHSDNLSHK